MTLTVLAITFVLLIIYDIIIVITRGGEQTISWQGWLIARRYPLIPLVLGVILGHMFWVQNCLCNP